MLLKVILSAALLALSIDAAAVPGKSFKFQVDDPKKGKYFLGDAKGAGTQDESKALICELNADVLKCGGQGFPKYTGDMTKLSTVSGGSSGWSIDANDNIKWSAKSGVRFSIGFGGSNDVWAETCPDAHGHFTSHGTAKAVYV